MWTKIRDLDPVERQEVAKERRSWKREAAIQEAQEHHEFILTRLWYSFLAGDPAPVFPFSGINPAVMYDISVEALYVDGAHEPVIAMVVGRF
jgi:hypothetical protein